MRRGMGVQPDLFQAPAPSMDLPVFLRGKAVDLLRTLLTEAISSELARGEENELLEGGNDHNHG
jgi:hypothetical protein